MFSAIRRRLTYANVTMTLALMFAMSGGAYAAGKYLITSSKQIKPSVLASLKGKAGAAGPAGANGAQGPAGPGGAVGKEGPAGKEGPVGKEGLEGKAGTNGTNGKSVTNSEFSGKREKCEEGGSEFTVGSAKTFACNGAVGKEGKEGSPWTDGGTLPRGSTETGIWSYSVSAKDIEEAEIPISFTIPLAKGLSSEECPKGHPCQIHFINTSGLEVNPGGSTQASAECKGTAEAPSAEPGNLCIYATDLGEAELPLFDITINPGVGSTRSQTATTGTIMLLNIGAGNGYRYGTWAVTGE